MDPFWYLFITDRLGEKLFSWSFVVLDEYTSAKFSINTGIPQATLFLIYHQYTALLMPAYLSQSYSLCCICWPTISNDLCSTIDRGSRNLVNFNAGKTQACFFTKKLENFPPDIYMSGLLLLEPSHVNVVGVDLKTENVMSWPYNQCGEKFGPLIRCKRYFSPDNLAVYTKYIFDHYLSTTLIYGLVFLKGEQFVLLKVLLSIISIPL